MATLPHHKWTELNLAERQAKGFLQHYDEFPTDIGKSRLLTWDRMKELHQEARTERICKDVMES